MAIDYQSPPLNPRRPTWTQMWVAIALWIVITVFLPAVAYGVYAVRNDPNTWR